jgi:hypothetical protein
MIKTQQRTSRAGAERKELRRRTKQFYDAFNSGSWKACFTMIDPKLRNPPTVRVSVYAEQMRAFQEAFGSIKPWHIRISLHLEKRSGASDARPFAYVYVVWQDAAHGFHMFRERWVKHGGQWYTRVVGLVPNQNES